MTVKQNRIWFVVRTKIKGEHRAAASLREAGFRVHLRKFKKTVVHHRTKKKEVRIFTLFQQYLFVGVSPRELNYCEKARKCDGAIGILSIAGIPMTIPAEKVRELQLAQRHGKFDNIEKEQNRLSKAKVEEMFPVGSSVRFKENHPLAGFPASVEAVTGRESIKTMIEIFGRLSVAEIDVDDIELNLDDDQEAA